jgi:hypothetical protein
MSSIYCVFHLLKNEHKFHIFENHMNGMLLYPVHGANSPGLPQATGIVVVYTIPQAQFMVDLEIQLALHMWP